MKGVVFATAAAAALFALAVRSPVRSQEAVRPPDIEKTRGKPVPDVALIAEDSTTFRFASLAGKPILVSPIFTSCPHTCRFITSSLRDALAAIGEPGVGYEVLTLSFDPADGPAEMRAYRERLALPAGWRLAVASAENLAALLDAIDFRYESSDVGGFAHPNVIAVIDPELKVSGYVHGVQYEVDDVREVLSRAARRASLVEKAKPLLIAVGLLGLLTMTTVLIVTGRGQRRARA